MAFEQYIIIPPPHDDGITRNPGRSGYKRKKVSEFLNSAASHEAEQEGII